MPSRLVPLRRVALVALLTLGCAPLRRAGAPTLRVMSFNIHSGHGNLDGVADVVRATGADVVALQEVDVHWAERSGFADQATALGERLGMTVRFAPIYRLAGLRPGDPPREFGVALLTRLPIVRWRNDTLTRLSTQERDPAPVPMPGLLEATLDVRGTPVRVLDAHLDYRADPRVRVRQVAELVALLGASDGPTLLLGDLNAPPDAPELQPLLARLHDAAAGRGLSYPADAPTKRIDYVLASAHFRVRTAAVVATGASDHRPVVADLALAR